MGFLKSKSRTEDPKGRIRPLAESASQKVGSGAGQVRDHLGPAVGTAREKMSPYAEKAVERGATAATHAVEKVSPVIDDVLGRVGPATEHAAEKARERLNDDVLPKVTAALAALAAAAEPAVEETTRRGRATKAALKGEIDVPKKKSHKMRKLMILLGFGAIVGAVAKKLLTPPEPAWQSTPTSGREFSSSPASARHAASDPAAKSEPGLGKTGTQSDQKTDTTTSDANETVAEKDESAKPVAGTNGAAKKTTSSSQRRSSGSSNNSKPRSDS